MELLDDNLTFDPSFDSDKFLTNTMTYFSALGLTKLTGKNKQ
jgi:hypothetical protein